MAAVAIRVCVAEDNVQIQKYFVDLLKHEPDIQVTATARSGREVVSVLNERPCDVLLMDVEMEQRYDGIEAAARVADEHPGVRVIMLTIHEDIDTIYRAFESGAVDFIVKNCSASTVIKAIKDAYENRSSMEPRIAEKIRGSISGLREIRDNLARIVATLSSLTKMEKAVLKLILQKKSLREIAQERYIELPTVKYHVGNILRKFQVKRRKEILQQMTRLGIDQLFQDSD